jgi:hypothetical protein
VFVLVSGATKVGRRLIIKWIVTVSIRLCSDLAANGLEVEGEIVVCNDNRSLPDALKCDFKWDCLEGSDEWNCGK